MGEEVAYDHISNNNSELMMKLQDDHVHGNKKQQQHAYGDMFIEKKNKCGYFQMPLHYPRYKKSDYESMDEWKLDCLFIQYGLPVHGDLEFKRNYAIGTFLWPTQY
ncbi:hypothetical protein MKW92_033483 [Papaver armeniacum]|nr:hypothetical protein MKW92_033483 [Papaver armeniacum]